MDNKKEKKIKEAAALKYDPENGKAPKIVALGKGEIAEKMLETAKNNDVPVYEDATLAHTLNTLNLLDEIPSELYEVVAQIMVFVSELDRSHGERYAGIKRRQ